MTAVYPENGTNAAYHYNAVSASWPDTGPECRHANPGHTYFCLFRCKQVEADPKYKDAGASFTNSSSGTANCTSANDGEFIWPLPGAPSSYTVTSMVGSNEAGIHDHGHKGTDIAATTGTNILAAMEGEVVLAEDNGGGFGNHVIIRHQGKQLITIYGHMSKITTSKGATVKAGDKIGEVGSTAVADLGSTDANIVIDTGTYWSKDWLVYNLDNKLIIRRGNYPIYNKTKDSDFAITKEIELKFTPAITTHNSDERIIITANGADVYTYDVIYTTEREYRSDIEITSINWLDDFLYWQAKGQTIVVRDFNGDNRREILNETLGTLPVTISANNRYMYFFTSEEIPVIDKTTDTTKESTTEVPTTDSSNSENTTNTKTIYHLTREKL